MRTLLALSMTLLCACATPAPKRPALFRPEEMPERVALPPTPDEAKLDGFPGGERDAEPIEKGKPSPMDGIVVSERRAARDSEYRNRYRELRLRMEADYKVFDKHRMLYESQLDVADEQVRNLQPTWLQQHLFEIGFVGGMILGAGATIGIAYAITGAAK